jgi:hypothetical protein
MRAIPLGHELDAAGEHGVEDLTPDQIASEVHEVRIAAQPSGQVGPDGGPSLEPPVTEQVAEPDVAGRAALDGPVVQVVIGGMREQRRGSTAGQDDGRAARRQVPEIASKIVDETAQWVALGRT